MGQIMHTANIHRIFIVAGITSLFVSYLGIWGRVMSDPVERTGSDFIAYYAVGRVAQNEETAHVYDPLLQQEIQEEQVGFKLGPRQVLLYYHLPFLTPVLQIVVNEDYINSFYRWVFILILIYIVSIVILSRVLRFNGIDQSTILIAAIGAFLFLPLFVSLLNGQDTALLLLGASIWVFGLLTGKELISGLGLSLTTVRPHLALVFALTMVFHYRKVFMGFIIGSLILALISFLTLGISGTLEFINILLISAGGEWYGIHQNAMFNFIGLLLRIFPWLEATTVRAIGWIVYGVTIIALCTFWARSKELETGKIGLTVILALFTVPHLHFHDLTLLLIPIYELIRSSTGNDRLKTSIAAVLPIAISLVLLLGNISPLLQYTFPYLIMLALARYLYYSKARAPIS